MLAVIPVSCYDVFKLILFLSLYCNSSFHTGLFNILALLDILYLDIDILCKDTQEEDEDRRLDWWVYELQMSIGSASLFQVKKKKITTSSMSIYCIHMMSCLVSIIVSSVSFASVMVIHGVKCPPTVISIDQLHNFPAIYSRCVLVLPSHQMYYTWLMTMYWQVTLIMYVMSQDWYAMWNIAARMDIHHTMILYSFTYMQQMYANLMQCHCYCGQHIVDNVMWTEFYFVQRSIHS